MRPEEAELGLGVPREENAGSRTHIASFLAVGSTDSQNGRNPLVTAANHARRVSRPDRTSNTADGFTSGIIAWEVQARNT